MKIPDSGFSAVLQSLAKQPETPERSITQNESETVVEGFRAYARHLVAIIDSKGND